MLSPDFNNQDFNNREIQEMPHFPMVDDSWTAGDSIQRILLTRSQTLMNSLVDSLINGWSVAPFHVQVELQKDPEPYRQLLAHGRVVRVFRSDGRIVLGDRIAFRLWVCERGEEPTGEPFVYREDFHRSTHMELYLDGRPPKWEIAGYGVMLLDSPSQTPQMTLRDLEEFRAPLEKAPNGSTTLISSERLVPDDEDSEGGPTSWFERIWEPLCQTRAEAEDYISAELSRSIPKGWSVRRLPDTLTWAIERQEIPAGEWPNQEFDVTVTNALDYIIFTYGNNDVGPFDVHHALQRGVVVMASALRHFGMEACLKDIMTKYKPNEWGYT